ncbi:MAG TPA: hypothetical protein VFN10_11775 [Thermoanaerobaculia bacterium]|nr:hypothetical protein [Thermoanaerobaculia bacterium]
MQFDEVLRTFRGFFEREGIRYALAGGLALQAWGHSRTTHDADFVIDGSNRQRVIDFTESLGYRTSHISDGYSNHRHSTAALGAVDFLYVYGDTADQVLGQAISRTAVGVDLPVARPEHLIAMKVTAMKNAPRRVLIDAPDIAFLLSIPGIDKSKARDYFARHGLLKIYDELEKEH